MGPRNSTILLLLGLLGISWQCVHATGGRVLLQGHFNSSAGGAPAPPFPANCTPPRTFQDTQKPFCFVPEYASPGARKFLLSTAAGAIPWPTDVFNQTALAMMRRFYRDFSINGSTAAVTTLLRSTRNDTIAGVPVVFGLLKNSSTDMKPADTKLLVYLHGGGYIIGSCHFQWSTPVPTAARAGLTTLCVEYRLAPEHPFPAGLNDVVAVYKELLKQGYQSKNIVLLGDSAGGGLVAAVAIQLQREGVQLPAALGMFSPWADPDPRILYDTQETLIGVDPVLASAPNASNVINLTLSSMALGYVGKPAAFADPLVAPLRADWAKLFPDGKLPPTLMQAGLREGLLSQDVQLYHAMKKAAPTPGRVTISPYDVMWHVFQSYWTLPEAEAAHQEMADFFRRALSGTFCPA